MSRELFVGWLSSIGELLSNQSYYIHSEKYKSFVFKQLMDPYIEQFKAMYKHMDVSTYKKCMAFFRQLCKVYHISYEYKIRYASSSYYIDYYFYV